MEQENSSYIRWVDYSYENLLKEYSEYVERINKDKRLNIVTNTLCLVKYTKPKINNGISSQDRVEYIKTKNKIMTSTLLISYDKYTKTFDFSFGNVTPEKFAKMEDILQ